MVAHLNIHTTYDLLFSSLKIDDVVKKAQQNGYEALAITDTNVLYGFPKFYDACLEHHIKPIFGMTIHLSNGLYTIETVLLARNNKGLTALYQLSSAIKMKDKDLVPLEWLHKYSADLAIIFKEAQEEHQSIINEFVDHEAIYINHTSNTSIYDLKVVWLKNARYLDSKDIDTIPALEAIKNNTKLDLVNDIEDIKEHFFSENELQEMQLSEEIWQNTSELASQCTAEIQYHQDLLPKFETPTGESSKDYLWSILEQKLQEFDLHQDERYVTRLNHEYKIITDMGFEDYFLIVSDLIHYAKTHDVMVGPGRGSSAGSLVSYLLGITTINPIKYNLLFERFLNPERVTMPDIDIDFEDTRREKVIQYVQEKYGEHHVSGIVTFGHLLARAVARDVGRIMGFDDITLNEISKLIPHRLGITLEEAYQNDEFKQFVHRNHRHEKWFEISRKLEGLPRHTSTHAAGIIINERPLYNYVPITTGDTGLLTQWTMTEAERLGLLKIDFLGLRNLSIIHQIITQVKKDLNIDIDIENIPMDDEKVFALLSKGNTTGIFQLESEGVRKVLVRLQPEHFEDIVAVTSLYRPGPMEEIPTYISRRHNQSDIQYLHPDLEPILKRTYGVIIYQEQIMQIASQFASFSYGQADILRRAMSKKNRTVLENERQHFVNGAVENGYDEAVSIQIFDLILKFADYGFPRAHAVSYSKIAYIMAYLKAHYPNYFYANILSNVVGNESKTAAIIDEAKSQNLNILPPDINKSHWFYKETESNIYLSLGAIKGVGYQSVKNIVDERYQNGNFKDFFDFARRIPKRIKTRKLLEALILVGAFDSLGKTRATLLSAIDQVLDEVSNVEQDDFLFDMLTPKQTYEDKEELSDQMISNYEKEYLGFYISNHPVEKLFNNKQYLGIFTLKHHMNSKPILVQIDRIKQIRTKNGQNMAFLTLNDGRNNIDGVIFPDKFKQFETVLKENEIYVVYGKFEKRNQQVQLVVNYLATINDFEEKRIKKANQIIIRNVTEIEEVRQHLSNNKENNIEVMIYNESSNETMTLGFIKREMDYLTHFINLFKPSDIRIV
ncbi:DNA polymerase III subunit alpha [Staphylococcus petrasii]|uniref:DNA polymerase III subunit alpha n=1 Tax=Staphylococcus petrasii TaxID=1276936 RepID=UPI000CD06EC1|nr:DNA polymerase III subunit alpha [Staphylococcus petrasii]PNZ83075.1 DNA polymerase III subunit alpha [Staphylococcus petrasii]TGA82985.1 DNA polymerase III subunit alpha [Staphylococcus petrasii]SUM59821.1 DNA polymerase III subunit alpha [Staphylococcus petrasii]